MPTELDKPAVELLIDDMTQAYKDLVRQDIRPQSKQDHFYMSGIHSCTRHLAYQLSDGDKRPAIDEYLQALFTAGSTWESKIIVPQLLQMGFQFVHGQQRLELPYHGSNKSLRGKVMATGKIDGAIIYKSVEIPVEIKTTDGNKFRRINSIDDLLEDQFGEKWVNQLLMYLYAKNKEQGLFVLSDTRGHLKLIPLYLGNHLDIAESALKRMEKAFEAYHSKQTPDRISYHPKICGYCAFNAICLPSQVIEGSHAIDDPEVESLIERHEDLKKAADDFKEIHDTVAGMFKDRPTTIVNQRFSVTPSKRVRVSYDTKQLTDEQRKAIKKETEFTVLEIQDLTAGKA